MATYVYESGAGDRIEREFPIGTAPALIFRNGFDQIEGWDVGGGPVCRHDGEAPRADDGELDRDGATRFRRIICGVMLYTPVQHRAAYDDEARDGRQSFVESGDAWMVREGLATTKDMGKAMSIIKSVPESAIQPPPHLNLQGNTAKA